MNDFNSIQLGSKVNNLCYNIYRHKLFILSIVLTIHIIEYIFRFVISNHVTYFINLLMHLGVCSILFSEFYMLCVHAIKGYNVTDKNERLRNDIYSIILGLLVVAVWIHIAIYEGKSIDGYDNAYLFDVVFDY